MEDFKTLLKTMMKRKVIDGSYEGQMCLGCDDEEYIHTCETTLLEKIEQHFTLAWIQYSVKNAKMLRSRLQQAVLIELLKDIMPHAEAEEKAKEIGWNGAHVSDGGGSSIVSSSTEDE